MKARELPCVRTARYAIARSTRWTGGPGCLIVDTPSCRHTSFGHRIITDTPPWLDWTRWYALWREHHGDKDVATAYLCFEAPGEVEAPSAPPGITPYVLSAMRLDRHALHAFTPRPMPAGLELRAVQGDDWRALKELALTVNHWHGDPTGDAYLDWALAERRAQVQERGQQLAVFDGERAVAAAALIDGPTDSRYQDVQTHPEHRGRGLASRLVSELAHGSLAPVLWIAAERGSQPERIYERIGFRTRSTSWEFGHPSPRSEAQIATLTAALEDGSLAPDDWHHREHLLVAAQLLRQGPTFQAALDRMRAALRCFLAAQGIETTQSAGYHETITRGWLLLVQRELDPHLPLADAALAACLALGDKRTLLQHWRRETLTSWDSRRSWVEPDLAPIEPR